MNYLKISIGIFIALAASRFIPHPPNFTSLLALSFYVPVFLGKKYVPALLTSFVITDLIIGFHNVTFFTWGSVVLIGLMANHFSSSIVKRVAGSLLGAVIFFVVTNFGVWVSGFYGYSLGGFITCYLLAIPFFAYSLISTVVFSSLIEIIYKLKQKSYPIFKKI